MQTNYPLRIIFYILQNCSLIPTSSYRNIQQGHENAAEIGLASRGLKVESSQKFTGIRTKLLCRRHSASEIIH